MPLSLYVFIIIIFLLINVAVFFLLGGGEGWTVTVSLPCVHLLTIQQFNHHFLKKTKQNSD